MYDPPKLNQGAPKRFSLNFAGSTLASVLCNGDVNNCQPEKSTVILASDIPCFEKECEIEEPRTIEASPGIWFEYVRPPCVNLAFYNNPKTIFRNWGSDKFMCGNPENRDASTICCVASRPLAWGESAWRNETFSGERVKFATSQGRCNPAADKRLCYNPWISNTDCTDPLQGGCDQSTLWYWSQNNCTQYIKINLEGSVAIVHQHGVTNVDYTSK